jgi:hypothetical protein
LQVAMRFTNPRPDSALLYISTIASASQWVGQKP